MSGGRQEPNESLELARPGRAHPFEGREDVPRGSSEICLGGHKVRRLRRPTHEFDNSEDRHEEDDAWENRTLRGRLVWLHTHLTHF